MTSWRIINTGALDGASNMAVDEALLCCFNPAHSRPVLRLYGWSPPTFSIGRFQQAGEVLDLEKCAAAGVPVVQRMTGGGAIYHTEELTYSLVCAPHHIPDATSVPDSFRLLTRFLLRFYRQLGLDACHAADYFPAGALSRERNSFCYAGKEDYDIVINGKKIGGNAQRRLRRVIFQHGSIPLQNRATQGAAFLRQPVELATVAGALQDFEVSLCQAKAAELLSAAFAEMFPVGPEEDFLTAEEEAQAALLRAQAEAKSENQA